MTQADAAVPSHDEVVDAVLGASRALVAIAVRSLAAAHVDVTLPQYRALVVLGYAGAQRTTDLATELSVNSSTATRLIDRLVRRRLVVRDVDPEDRRATRVAITDAGREVIRAVTEARRSEVRKVLRKIPAEQRRALVSALELLLRATGESPEQMWSTGWTAG